MVRKKVAGVIVWLTLSPLLAFSVGAVSDEQAARKEYSCRLLTQAPQLDGDVTGDPAWRDAPVGALFRNLRTGQASVKQTSFRIGYTAEALFIGAVCEEPNPDGIRADLTDGESFREEDSLTVFLVPNEELLSSEGVPELLFAVNAIGSRTSPRTLRKWQAATYIGDKAWSVEIALPWAVVGRLPAEGEAWKLNLCRYIPSSGRAERSTWANLEYELFDVEQFGTLHFEGLGPELRQEIEARIRDQAITESYLLYSRPQVGVLIQSESSKDRVVYNQGAHVAPRLSPDRNRVLFNSVEGGEMGVWLVDRSGHEKKRIAKGAQAAWSPDGARIVFQRDGRLIERALDSGTETIVSPEGALPLAFPTYLPGGGIAGGANSGPRFLCSDTAGRQVYLLSPGSDKPIEMLVEGEIGSAPRCSPDGRTLAYQDGAHLYLMDVETRDMRQLTADPGVQSCPVWAADGQSLCYARASCPPADTWDICRLEVANPETVNLIEPRVHPGFDWTGSSAEAARTMKVLGTSLGLWRGKGAFDPARDPDAQAGWELVTEGTPAGPLDGNVVIGNDWLFLDLSGEGARLVLKGEGMAAAPMALRVFDEAGGPAEKVTDIQLVRNSGDGVMVTASFLARENRTVKATVRIPRARPFVEVRVDNAAGRVGLQVNMALVLVPDRFSNDLILVPADVAPGARVPLPQTPIALGCLPDSRGMVMLIDPPSAASFAVTNGEDGGRFTALMAAPGEKGVVMAVLTGNRIWQRAALARDPGDGTWRAQWERPFLAEWRVAACGKDAAYARMWNAAELGALGGKALPIEEAFEQPPEAAVVYAWARDAATPMEVLTPADILLDVLGIQGYVTALDIEGIRGCRSGDGSTPFRELIVHTEDWHPAKAIMEEESELGILEAMGSVFAVGTPGVRTFIADLGNDAVNLLQGLDTRIGEYEAFLGDVAAFCEAHEKEDRQGFLASVRDQAGKVLESVRGARRTDIAEVREALETVLNIVGTRDGVTLTVFQGFCQLPGNEEWAAIFDEFYNYLAAKEGRIWYHDALRYELWYEDEFRDFSHRCQKILAERQKILSQYRPWVKRVRDGAARMMVTNAEFKPIGDELREKTRTVLRNRYYLERDWRGETPLPSGALR